MKIGVVGDFIIEVVSDDKIVARHKDYAMRVELELEQARRLRDLLAAAVKVCEAAQT